MTPRGVLHLLPIYTYVHGFMYLKQKKKKKSHRPNETLAELTMHVFSRPRKRFAEHRTCKVVSRRSVLKYLQARVTLRDKMKFLL